MNEKNRLGEFHLVNLPDCPDTYSRNNSRDMCDGSEVIVQKTKKQVTSETM
ncbi:hypothetical protein THOM_2946 [Trachipleistophora hominis]|uniref:Uncharacterized protein n=1 Tax=Trachipleistophora hominis TaxID=72359 RepID=L7JS78_TRAHO|nr:hypothetical protein THOM_2946 [Trachipleistophora hominis]